MLCREWEGQEGEYLHKHVTREREGRDGRYVEGGRVIVNFQHRRDPRTTETKDTTDSQEKKIGRN